jgi:gamma-glutamylputrescine oxidase
MTLSFWQRAAREPTLEADYLVVGGGIIGASTAYWLARINPEARVVLIEKHRLAAGATGRNAGFILQGVGTDYLADIETFGHERARRLWQFTRENRDLIETELRARAFSFEASGSLIAGGTSEEAQRLRAAVPRMRADGAPVAFVPADETNRRIMSRGFHGALYVPSGAVVDSVHLVRHIASSAKVQVLEHHPFLEMKAAEGGFRVETPGRAIQARAVVFALNAYLPRLFPDLGRYVRPVRAQMLSTAPMLPRWLPVSVYSHEGFYYLRQVPAGNLLLGGARHLHEAGEVGFDDETTLALQRDLQAYLVHHFPQTEGLAVTSRWSGVMGFSPDRLPVVGKVPGHEGAVWAAGFTGHGMAYGFRFGRMLAEVAMGRRDAEGLDLFTADRFEKAAVA